MLSTHWQHQGLLYLEDLKCVYCFSSVLRAAFAWLAFPLCQQAKLMLSGRSGQICR